MERERLRMEVAMMSAALVLATMWVSQGAKADAAGDLEARWRREYPAAAAALEKNARSFLARGTLDDQSLGGAASTARMFTLARSGEKKLVVRDRETFVSPRQKVSLPYRSVVLCRTPDYVFLLKKESPDDPYSIEKHAAKFHDAEDYIHNLMFDEYARCATVYQYKTLLERMQSPSFVVKAVDLVHEDGRELTRIDYAVDLVLDGVGKVAETGSVQLDPARGWSIRGAKGVHRPIEVAEEHKDRANLNPREFEVEVEYKEVADHVFFPSRLEVTESRQPADPDLRQHRVMELSEVALGAVPDRVFKLSGYGLPDAPPKPANP